MASTRVDLYELVTSKVVAALEGGTPPWASPWHGGNISPEPANLATGRPYRGINVLLLNLHACAAGYPTNRWLTFQQARTLGAHVRRGEEGTPVVFFKITEREDAAAPADAQRVTYPLLRRFTVFNAAQVDGLPPEYRVEPGDLTWDPCAEAESLIAATGAQIQHGGLQAFYAPGPDLIRLPDRERFSTAEGYYSVALHELTHWTGHPTRCNRPLGGKFGLSAYAFEELVAEMGAAFLTARCRMATELQHAAYVHEWLQALKNDKRLIFRAASFAQRASDFVLAQNGCTPDGFQEERKDAESAEAEVA